MRSVKISLWRGAVLEDILQEGLCVLCAEKLQFATDNQQERVQLKLSITKFERVSADVQISKSTKCPVGAFKPTRTIADQSLGTPSRLYQCKNVCVR